MKKEKSKGHDEFMAAAIGDLEWLKQSLRDKDTYIDFDENGLASIHLASIHGRFECIRYLIEDLKVDVNLSSLHGWRPIHLCINNKIGKHSLQTLLFLIYKGANLSICNEDGLTPTHQAAKEGNYPCLKQLIEAGADFTLKDNRENLPIDLAKIWGHKNCTKLLATYSWHKDKARLINEKYEMKKSEIIEILSRLEHDFEIPEQNQFRGSQPFYKWLFENVQKKSKKQKNNEDEKSKLKENKLKNYMDDISNRKYKEVSSNSDIWKYFKPNQYFNDYLPNLRDIYPRHPYTIEPLQWSTPKELNPKTSDLVCKLLGEKNQNLIRKAAQERSRSKKSAVNQRHSPFRRMYYNNDSVIDLQKKKIPKDVLFQKSNDAVFCFTNDINSTLFKCALSFPIIEKPTSSNFKSANHFIKESDKYHLSNQVADILTIED